jgi:hypothetical protein
MSSLAELEGECDRIKREKNIFLGLLQTAGTGSQETFVRCLVIYESLISQETEIKLKIDSAKLVKLRIGTCNILKFPNLIITQGKFHRRNCRSYQ